MDEIGSEAKRVTAAVLAEMPNVPHFTVDAERNVVDVSPAMERLTGFDRSEVVGRSCLLLHRCEDCLSGCGVFENGYVSNKPLELYRSDGSKVAVRKSARLFFDDEGEVAGAVEIVRPIAAGRPAPPSHASAGPSGASQSAGSPPLERGASEAGDEPVPPAPGAQHDGGRPSGASEASSGEVERIRAALAAARYRRTEAARSLGMSRTTLWRKMKRYGL